MYTTFNKNKPLTTLKIELGSWMYALLSTFTKDQFLHMVKNMMTDPSLLNFYE